jgi:hypothetical protein
LGDGGFLAAGGSRYGLYWSSIYLVRIDSAGQLIWSRKYNTQPYTSRCDVTRVLPTAEGGFVVCGMTNANQPLKYGYVLGIDSLGTVEWQNVYGAGGGERNNDMIDDGDGYVICGSTGTVNGTDDLLLYKIDYSGNMEWQLGYGVADSNIIGQAIIKAQGGDYVVAGMTDLSGNGDYDVMLIKSANIYDSSLCHMKMTSIVRDTVTLVAAGFNNADTIPTYSIARTFSDSAGVTETIVCDEILAVNEFTGDEFVIYPNPAGDRVTLRLPDRIHQLQLEITDSMGRIVFAEKISGMKENEITISSALFSNGVYRCMLRHGNETVLRQLVIVR